MSYASPGFPPVEDSLVEGVLLRRVAAWCIDAVVLAVILAVLWVALGFFGLVTLGLGLPLMGLLPAVPFVYHAGFIAGERGATPGQAMMDLVVRREQDLGPPSLLQAILFTGGLYLTLAAGVVWLLATLFIARKRALHDVASGIVVVRRGALTQVQGFGIMQGGPDRI